ncbi:MAG: cupin domain-containing protein [Burkholderiales bacterium]|nr:cupin domain-containing protein [Burkholderiales bacterium]
MKTRKLKPEELPTYIARFAELKPNKDAYASLDSVPPEAYEMVAARDIYVLMGPQPAPSVNPAATRPAVEGAPGTTVYIVKCPPGNGPALHSHNHTRETFMALDTPFEVRVNDTGTLATLLKPFDLFAVPPGVTRAFRNLGDRDGHLLVMVQGPAEAVLNDISLPPSVGEEVARRYGKGARAGLEKIGMAFDIEVEV